MNSTMWTYFFMVVGILGIVLINLFSDILISNEQSYMILKEVTEASMIDAIDWYGYSVGYGRINDGVTRYNDPESFHCNSEPGKYRILKEKFVESFVRRFAESATISRRYKIYINDIDECPPKVSITITSQEDFPFLQFFRINYTSNTDGEDVVNSASGIIDVRPGKTTN